MRVKNVDGSSRFPKPAGFDSWLDYWEKQTGRSATNCSANSWCGRDLVGAHVQKVNSTDKCYYIVPLCRSCNQRNDEFEVDTNLLVPVPSNL